MAKIDSQTKKIVKELIAEGVSHRQIKQRVGVGLATISRIRNKKGEVFAAPEVEKDYKADSAIITTKSLHISTLEEALAYAEVDLEIWQVERFVVNSWEVTMGTQAAGSKEPQTYTNYQVKVWLKRKSPVVSAMEKLIAEIKTNRLALPKVVAKKTDGAQRMLEVSIFDPHLGLRCFLPGADLDWNVVLCEEVVLGVVNELLLLAEAYEPFEYILFPFGNDFLHSDNVFNTTTAGTPQPEADAWQEVYGRAYKLALAIIEKLKAKTNVKILVVPGNHARQSEFTLGKVIEAYYHNDKSITVNASCSPYKFHCFGVNLIGFEHGHSIKQQVRLAALMANECQDLWGKTYYREWHLGDQHRKGSGRPSMLEEQGVSVEFLPGLTVPNEWHRLKSYNWQKRAGMAYVWDRKAGLVSRLQVNINQSTGEIMKG